MRADRLLAELMLLQAEGTVTAGKLAERLEVSERTVYRDMYGLQVAGVPVVTRPGRGGGFSLYPGWRTDLTGMSADELAALAIAAVAGPVAEAPVVRSAVLKLAATLPAVERIELEQFQNKILIDAPPAQGTAAGRLVIRALISALRANRRLDLTIRRHPGTATASQASPLGLVAADGTWYLVWAPSRGRPRANPVPDILKATAATTPAEPPDGFELAAFWYDWRRRNRTGYAVTIRFDGSILHAVEGRFGGLGYALERTIETATTARIRFRSIEHARAALLPWGNAIEVVAPRSLRCTIADYAAQIVARYQQPTDARS